MLGWKRSELNENLLLTYMYEMLNVVSRPILYTMLGPIVRIGPNSDNHVFFTALIIIMSCVSIFQKLPLSELRYRRLDNIRPKIASVICIDIELIAELRRSKAISRADAEDIRAENAEYAKTSKLISAILRRTNECYNSFQEVLRNTKQTAAAQYLSEGK